ncbi:MAG: DUF1192 domain-containing protein [Alphaproteobacteria bacterium]
MDLDDLPRKQPGAAEALARESLDDLSVYELKERIELLEAEIARTQQAIGRKEAGQSAADKLFK